MKIVKTHKHIFACFWWFRFSLWWIKILSCWPMLYVGLPEVARDYKVSRLHRQSTHSRRPDEQQNSGLLFMKYKSGSFLPFPKYMKLSIISCPWQLLLDVLPFVEIILCFRKSSSQSNTIGINPSFFFGKNCEKNHCDVDHFSHAGHFMPSRY